MRTIYLIIIFLFSVISVFAQTEESNKYFNQGMELYNQGKYTEAIPCFEKSDSIDKITLDSTSNRRDYSAMWLASCYYHLAEFDKAKELDNTNNLASPIDRNKTILSDKYLSEGKEFIKNNEVEKALDCYNKCANLEKENIGDNSVSYANTLLNIYLCKKNNNINNGLDKLYQKISNIYKTELGQYSYQYFLINCIESFRLLWNSNLSDSSNIKNSLSLFIESYKIASKIREYHTDISDVLCGRLSYVIAYLYNKLAEYTERTYEERLYVSLSKAYYYHSKIAYAELEDYRKIMPIKYYKNNYDRSSCYEVLSEKQDVKFELYKHILEYSLIDLNSSAIAVIVRQLSNSVSDSIIYAYAMEKLRNKNYIDANQLVDFCRRTYLNKTESIEYDFYSTSHAYLTYMIIGENYYIRDLCMNIESFKKQKDYEVNYNLRKESLAWHEAQFGKYSRYYTKRLLEQSVKELFGNNNLNTALEYAQECLNICHDTPYADSLLIALAYKSIGICYTCMGKEYEKKAEHALKNSFEILYRNLKYDKFKLPRLEAMECNNRLVNESKDFYLRDEYKEGNVQEFLNLTIILNTLYKASKNIKALAYTTQRAINTLEKASFDKAEYPELYQDMCVVCYWDIRQFYTDKYLPTFDSIAMHNIIKYFRNQPAKQRNRYYLKNSIERYFSEYYLGGIYYRIDVPNISYQYWFENNLLITCYDKPSNITIGEAYNGALFSKGILLNTEIEMRKLIAESQDNTLINNYQKLQNNYHRLEKANIEEKKDINKEIEDIEAELLIKCKDYGDYTKKLSYKWEDVKSKLTNGAIAIEFVNFKTGEDSVIYAALIIDNKSLAPKMIPLFEKKQLQNIDRKNYYNSYELYSLIWKPIENILVNATKVYFSPIGELYNIAIESIPGIEKFQKTLFYRVSTTKSIITDNIKALEKKAIIYGGLKYDTDESTLIKDSHNYNVDRSLITDDNIADSLNLRNGVVYLPSTKEEALDIESKMLKSKIQVSLFTDKKGTETSIKSFSGKSMEIMHIATHGFYWTEEESKRMGTLEFIMNSANSDVEDKTLTRSGLLFSGANNALSGKKMPHGIDDGILTAKEISQMDLRKLDLVVLSACQTGLGEISGDGVFGLQRGFKKAGAKTLMMSLWKVDDKATQLLMSRFYSNLIAGKSKIESLRDAQKYVREYETEVEIKSDNRPAISAHAKAQVQQSKTQQKYVKKVHPYQNPKYWAAFILLDALN